MKAVSFRLHRYSLAILLAVLAGLGACTEEKTGEDCCYCECMSTASHCVSGWKTFQYGEDMDCEATCREKCEFGYKCDLYLYAACSQVDSGLDTDTLTDTIPDAAVEDGGMDAGGDGGMDAGFDGGR